MKEKNCTNCKYFFQHYTKQALNFTKNNMGHCGINLKTIKHCLSENKVCKHWAPADKEKERKLKLTDALTKMAKEIEEICIVLKNDE